MSNFPISGSHFFFLLFNHKKINSQKCINLSPMTGYFHGPFLETSSKDYFENVLHYVNYELILGNFC